jgi:hypothetical protein
MRSRSFARRNIIKGHPLLAAQKGASVPIETRAFVIG